MAAYDAVVAGAGYRGLLTALQSQLSGKKTLLIEKNNLPGGAATSFVRGRFEIDAALPELLEMEAGLKPGELRKLLNEYGVKLNWIRFPEGLSKAAKDSRDIYIPAHTAHELSNAMAERFRELGGDIWFNCRVDELLYEKDRVCGLKTSMGDVSCEYVLEDIEPKGEKSPAYSMFTVYLCCDKSAQKLGIKNCTAILPESSDSLPESIDILKGRKFGEYSIFRCYNIANPGYSAEGSCVCSLSAFVSAEDIAELQLKDYFRLKTALAKKLLADLKQQLGISLEGHIEEVDAASPLTYVRFKADLPAAEDESVQQRLYEKAKRLHPDYLELVIDEIVERGGGRAKTYYFKCADGSPFPYFRAGQYLALKLPIDGSFVTRSYSICSSPDEALKRGRAAITIHEYPPGFAADRLLRELKVGDRIISSAPQGCFFYDELRDCRNVIALAGGSGITPFMAMAGSIRDGIEDYNLTILAGNTDWDQVFFKDDLKKLCDECPKIKVVHVLSDEKLEGSEYGMIDGEIIKKYAPKDEEYSVFICGPDIMYRSIYPELRKLGINRRRFRGKLIDIRGDVSEYEDYPRETKDRAFKLHVIQGPKSWDIDLRADEPILVAMERAGLRAPTRCRCGECGWCRSKLLSGEVFIPKENDVRRWSDKQNNYIHPCACFALSDIELEIPGVFF